MNKNLLSLLILFALCLPHPLYAIGNVANQSFYKAKKDLLEKVYFDHHLTFYCGAGFTSNKEIAATNGYTPLHKSKRSQRIEWEHVVPAQAFGQSFKEWREGDTRCVSRNGKHFKGRKCAEKVNTLYRYMQADMHNLTPAIGEINGLRSNYSYAMIPGATQQFGTCAMKIVSHKAQPPANVRGDIARTYMYMNDTYPGRGIISNKNKKLFQAWAKVDPVDTWECERDHRIAAIQGNHNPYVDAQCH